MDKKLGLVDGYAPKIVGALSDTEYGEYERAASRLMQYSSDLQLFMIVRLNYADFRNLLEQYLREYVQNPSMNWHRMESMLVTANKCILNFLSAVRAFLDHSQFDLKKRYGHDSDRFRRFKDACSKAYDNYFSYRFLYGLRSYVQHCGMPVGRIKIRSRLEDQVSGKVIHSLSIYFNRDQLLTNYDRWKPQLRTEIQNLPAEFEVDQHITQMMNCLKSIHQTIIEDDLPDLVESARAMRELIAPTEGLPGTPCIIDLGKDPGSNGKILKMAIEWIPLHLVDMVKDIRSDT